MFPQANTVSSKASEIPRDPEFDDGSVSNNPGYVIRNDRLEDDGDRTTDMDDPRIYDLNERYRTTGIAGIAQYELLSDPKDNMCFIEAGKPDDATPMGFGRTHDRFYSIQWNPMIHCLFRPQPGIEDTDPDAAFRLENFNVTLGEKINEFLDELVRRPTLSYKRQDGTIARYNEDGSDTRNSSQILWAEPVVNETNIFRGESGPYNFYVGISICHRIVEGYQLHPIL